MFGFHAFSTAPFSSLSGQFKDLAAAISANVTLTPTLTGYLSGLSQINATLNFDAVVTAVRNINSNLSGDLSVGAAGSLVVSVDSGFVATIGGDYNLTNVISVGGGIVGTAELNSQAQLIRRISSLIDASITLDSDGRRVVGVGADISGTIGVSPNITAIISGVTNPTISIVVDADLFSKAYKDLAASLGVSIILAPGIGAVKSVGSNISAIGTLTPIPSAYMSVGSDVALLGDISGNIRRVRILSTDIDLSTTVVVDPTAIVSGQTGFVNTIGLSSTASSIKVVASDISTQIVLSALLTELIIPGEYKPVIGFTLYIDRQTNKILSIERNYNIDFNIDRSKEFNL